MPDGNTRITIFATNLHCDDALARTEPATLQYRVFHTPATLTRGGRRRRLNFPPDWPWTGHIQAIFQRLFALTVVC